MSMDRDHPSVDLPPSKVGAEKLSRPSLSRAQAYISILIELRVWEDLTPKQQENRKAKIPKLRSLRQEGKIAFFRADRLFVKDSPEAVPVLFQ